MMVEEKLKNGAEDEVMVEDQMMVFERRSRCVK